MYIVHLLTSWGTPYNHQSNPIERFHKTIRSLLKAKKPIRKNDWEKRLPTLILAYNANQHYSTLCSPARLFLCREANLPHLSLFPKFKLDSLHAIPLPILCAIFTELRARARNFAQVKSKCFGNPTLAPSPSHLQLCLHVKGSILR